MSTHTHAPAMSPTVTESTVTESTVIDATARTAVAISGRAVGPVPGRSRARTAGAVVWGCVAVAGCAAAVLLLTASDASAAPVLADRVLAAPVLGDPGLGGALVRWGWRAQGGPGGGPSLDGVLTNIRNWIMGLLALLATVYLTVGGVRYVLSAGEPGEVDAAKRCFRSAAFGYALAALAPVLVQILRGIVGA